MLYGVMAVTAKIQYAMLFTIGKINMKIKSAFILTVSFMFWMMSSQAMANQLVNNASPYLAMHGNDPVDWHTWGPEALKKAKDQDKMLFVSIGYFACHWCHVMQRESYADKEVAGLLNKHFISIKVDRELNPVLDERLIDFVQATAGRAGWPLNVFITPDGYPVIGMTYVPRATFAELIGKLQNSWEKERATLTQAAREVDDLLAVAREGENVALEVPLKEMQDAMVSMGMQYADKLQGGFGEQTKFPMAPQLSAMLEAYALEPQQELGEFLQLTLDQMSRRGLYDHVGGGFFRYTTDPGWYTPHYEKMLYTSAMLVPIYYRAAEVFKRPDYADIATRSLKYMLNEMSGKDHAFISSLSAIDNQGVEGGYYLWDKKTLKQHFNKEDMEFVTAVWDLLREPTPAEGILPHESFDRANIKDVFSLDDAALNHRLVKIRAKLKSVRDQSRVIPKDDKRLAGWNGLALAALASGSDSHADFKLAGKQLYQFMETQLWRNNGLVKAIDKRNQSLGKGGLFDYAAVAYGMARWAQTQESEKAMALAQKIINAGWDKFYSIKGWRQSEEELLPNPIYQRHIRDGALPSPEGLLIRATTILLKSREDAALKVKLQTLIARSSKSVEDEPFYFGSLISAAIRAAE